MKASALSWITFASVLAAGTVAVCACGGSSGDGGGAPASTATGGAGGSSNGEGGSGGVDFASINAMIIQPNCTTNAMCHLGSSSLGGLQLDGNDAAVKGRLVNQPSSLDPKDKRVVPGDPSHSLLYVKLSESNPNTDTNLDCAPQFACGVQMPMSASPLPAVQIQMVHDWIASGAN